MLEEIGAGFVDQAIRLGRWAWRRHGHTVASGLEEGQCGTVPLSAFCSRNAHDRNVLVRRPQSGLTRGPFLRGQTDRRIPRRAWKLMIFYARATRGFRKPSLDARSGRSISPYP